ncbi:pentapeptide repeat-containing protein [Pontibacter harenae]|uniref:pentapeptide repeat-containing protein n=1 Tax=Pontibacter harenae TaxID=2894083 RepID=UPI001E5CC7CF|nr:pentapeptide repeat-containing protein [Pontibacter harenae]MCC9167984.1 pentapeptide repeat-containing protein [Pontibacter harenae]
MNLVLTIIAAILTILILIFIPKFISKRIERQFAIDDLQKAVSLHDLENKIRQTIAQIIGGVILLFGAYTTIEKIGQDQKGRLDNKFYECTIELSRTDTLNNLRKLGAIYMLEDIANELPEQYYHTSIEVFTQYLKINHNVIKSFDTIPDVMKGAVMNVLARRQFYFGKGEKFPLNLTSLNLRGVQVENSNFDETLFLNSDLSNSHFSNSSFSGANFNEAIVKNASFFNCDFTRAQLGSVKFNSTNIAGCNFSNASLWSTDFRKAQMAIAMDNFFSNEVDFTGADLLFSNLDSLDLRSVILKDADLAGASLRYCDLSEVNMENARFWGATQNDKPIPTDLSFSNLKKANLLGADLQDAILINADLSESNIEKAYSLEGANLTSVKGLTIEQKKKCKELGAIGL